MATPAAGIAIFPNLFSKPYIEDRYDIVFSSQQSYYEIFDAAGLSWKKSQKRNHKTDPELVKKNKRIDPMARSSS